jgi:hypothetical protein
MVRDVGARQVFVRDPHRGLLSGLCHFRFWHETDLLPQSLPVRC